MEYSSGCSNSAKKAGDQLRRLRIQLGITARAVEQMSRQIALEHGNDEFIISHGRIIQVENNESTPSIYKLCSLSVIYGVSLNELVSMFADLERLSTHRLQRDETRPLRLNVEQPGKHLTFPLRFGSSSDVEQTGLLSRMVEVWGEIPVALIQHLNLRSMQYGIVGLNDYTLYPLLKPGSLVQIDDSQRKVMNCSWNDEYARPIYFVEFRDGYVCSWCETHKNQLLVVPHPLSSCQIKSFNYHEAEIVGRVVAVAARLAPIQSQPLCHGGATAVNSDVCRPIGSLATRQTTG
jgi:transcriptional regulator with XRE-family HTH domain